MQILYIVTETVMIFVWNPEWKGNMLRKTLPQLIGDTSDSEEYLLKGTVSMYHWFTGEG